MEDPKPTKSQDGAISKGVMVDAIAVDETKTKDIKENLEKYEQLFGADEDAFDQPTTSRKELWSYYLYYNVSGGTESAFYASDSSTRVTMELVLDHIPKPSFNQP